MMPIRRSRFFPFPRLRPVLLLIASCLMGADTLPARDAYVLISGGGTPLTNNYSQYLQAKAMAAYFAKNYPSDSRWAFFGVGNRPDQPAEIADVRRQYKQDGLVLESWEAGTLPDNRPATRESILTALRDEILPTVADGGTLFLFVGDHGSLSRSEPKESTITLWQLRKRDPQQPNSWFTDIKQELGVNELRDVLRAGLGSGRVVFCMTQCHSGGFLHLGVPRTVAPDSNWFTAVPDWAYADEKPAQLAAAGFTATDEASLAAGCDPDPDPDRWAGYERFFPESLLGIDLFTSARSGPERDSFAAAHEAATLVDQTIDLPQSSSELYLTLWAQLIEKRLTGESLLTPGIAEQVAAYYHDLDHGIPSPSDPLLAARQAQFARFSAQLARQNPSMAERIESGSAKDLESMFNSQRDPLHNQRRAERTPPAAVAAWNEVLRPAWKEAVNTEDSAALPVDAASFEKRVLNIENTKRPFILSRGGRDPLFNEIYWRSGYAHSETLDVDRARTIAQWAAERHGRILRWAALSADENVRAAGKVITKYLGGLPPVAEKEAAPESTESQRIPRTLSDKTAAQRTLFYRRALAAWSFLIATDNQPALAELRRLITLENTSMPGGI